MTNVYASPGSKATLVAKSSELHPRFAEAGKVLRDAFVQRGIDVHVSTQVAAVRGNGSLHNRALQRQEHGRRDQDPSGY